MAWGWSSKAGKSGNGDTNGNESCTRNAGPDFLCVGAHKSGTTWLYQQLESHPDFWMPPVKELHYFDQLSRVPRAASTRCRDERDRRFLERLQNLSAKPSVDFENYARLFEAKGPLLSGDISPNYSILRKEVIRRIARYFPWLNVIFLARDPVERIWSHLSMEVQYRQIEPFNGTDIEEVNRQLRRRGMLLRSFPTEIVSRWKRYFRPERFRIYFFDDLQCNPAELRRSVFSFLGADPDKPSRHLTADHNNWAGIEKLPLTDGVRSHLGQFFKNELKACAAELGGPAKAWPARYGFSAFCLLWQLADDLDLLVWCDWLT